MGEHTYTFDLYRIFLNDQPFTFLLEVFFRTVIIYVSTLILLRWMGKRGMGQLTPFEFAIIVALGSAVGDPMFYDNVPILPALLTILVIVALQRLLARITEKHKALEAFVESEPRLLIEAGIIDCQNLHTEMLSRDELFEALRQEGIAHLGQVEIAYLEPSGKLSVIHSSPERPGLSTLPEGKILGDHWETDQLCCQQCGKVSMSPLPKDRSCATCGESEWVLATRPHSENTRQEPPPKS